jgi:hypothetical protein
MKKLLLLFFSLSLFTCSGGDDDNDNDNNSPSQSDVLSVIGTDYELESGNLSNFGPSSTSNAVNIDLDLFSSGISVVGCEAEGSGQDIYFEMWTSDEAFLDSGTYEIVSDDNYSLFDITYADYILDLDVDSNSDPDWIILDSGTVNVERSGNNYTISWDTIDENGNVVAGSYSGKLSYCDFSD